MNEKNKGYDVTKDNLTLAGHSLGGILTQAIGAVYQIKGYAFNPYGVDRLLSMPSLLPTGNLVTDILEGILHSALYKALSALGVESSYANWAKDHILNISYVDEGALNGDPL